MSADVVTSIRLRAIAACVSGNALEWYDFGVYGFFVPEIAQLFFPKSEPNAQLFTFLIFGFGYLTRPLGAVIFGVLGDRFGRRNALSASMALMAIATALIGLLPVYSEVGALAPALLLLMKVLQGCAMGGEQIGSGSYLIEYAPPKQRGLFTSFQQVGNAIGLLLASGVARGLHVDAFISHDALLAWGWRIPFLLGMLVGIFSFILRWKLADTPKFREIEEKGEVTQAPLREALTKNRREVLITFGLTFFYSVCYYVVLIYAVTFLSTVAKMKQSDALTISTIALFVYTISVLICGGLSDRIGRKPLMIASCVSYVVLLFPLFAMLATGNFALALTAQLILVILFALFTGPAAAVFLELMPTRVRYTGLGVGSSVAQALFGGFAPVIAGLFVRYTHQPTAAAAYPVLGALIALWMFRLIKESAFEPLR